MADPRIIVIGAGPAGVRAAEYLVRAGVAPVVIDENVRSGGQIYRRQPDGFERSYRQLYGFDAPKAQALHDAFDALLPHLDYRPDTLAWNITDSALYTISRGVVSELPFDAIVLATGATDRAAPTRGWTLPGCYSLGGSQIALKAQACSIGRKVVFMGTGPLLYLVAYQYAKAGAEVAGVLDTSPFKAQMGAIGALAARPSFLARGVYFRAALMRRGIPVLNGVMPVEITGDGHVESVRFRTADGKPGEIGCDAVAMGYHLRSEFQLADLAGCDIDFDSRVGQWHVVTDRMGRTSRSSIYMAGDSARILGADAAEVSGALVAMALIADMGLGATQQNADVLCGRMAMFERFRDGVLKAFPWPADHVRTLADDVVICRCETITAGELRAAAGGTGDAADVNRAKAFSRVGMGRCQGRYCGSAAAEILAAARGASLPSVNRIRGQAPVKPLSIGLVRDEAR